MKPVLLGLLTVLVAAEGSVRAKDAESPVSAVKDGAGLFSPEVIARSDGQIREIRALYHHDLVVETVKEVPAAQRRWFRFWSRKQVNQFLAQRARERAEAAGVDGVYVVICNDPKTVQVTAWPQGEGQTLSERDCEHLRRLIVHRLQKIGPDAALLGAVSETQRLFQERFAGAEELGANLVLAGSLLGLLALWLSLCLVRRKLRAADAREGREPTGGEATPALLGALFGVPAGYWIYDRLLPRGGGPPPALESPVPKHEPVPVDHDPENVPAP